MICWGIRSRKLVRKYGKLGDDITCEKNTNPSDTLRLSVDYIQNLTKTIKKNTRQGV